jgi:hypothetical protein
MCIIERNVESVQGKSRASGKVVTTKAKGTSYI